MPDKKIKSMGNNGKKTPVWKIITTILSCSILAVTLGFFLPYFLGNKPPKAVITPDFTTKTVYINETVYFSATNSTDPDGDDTIEKYEWLVDGKNRCNEERFIYTFTNTLSHSVKLVVTDDKGRKSETCIEIQAIKK